MTPLLQSGQHPDADQLSAFAEHALPPHEQQQTLAHLAECADCRAIVYLAQQPDLAEAAQPRPVAARRPWFYGWNLALPAALALAALVLITVHLRKPSADQHLTAANNTAHLEQPPAQALPAVSAKPLPAPIVKQQITPHPAIVMGAMPPKPMPVQPMLQQHVISEGHISFAAVQPGAVARTGAGLGGQPTPSVPGASISMNGIAPVIAPQQAALGSVDEARREFHSSASQYSSAAAPAAAPAPTTLNQSYMNAPPAPPPAAAPANTNQTVTVTTASAALNVDAGASSQVIENETYSSLPLAGLTAKKQPSLPSHLPAASTSASARQVLAIDTAGALFRSTDAGVTWQPVAAQWPGRAIKLQLTAPPVERRLAKAADSGAAISAAKAAPAAPAQPTFEITTDAGDTWTSTDGQTWKHK